MYLTSQMTCTLIFIKTYQHMMKQKTENIMSSNHLYFDIFYDCNIM